LIKGIYGNRKGINVREFFSTSLKRPRKFVIQNVSFTAARDTDVT